MVHNPRRAQQLQARTGVQSALKVLNREWFGGRFYELGVAGEYAMVLLLLNAFASADAGSPLNKGGAMRRMGVRHGRTSDKLIKRAIKLGLLSEKASPRDGRVRFLFPTPLLERIIEDEMARLT